MAGGPIEHPCPSLHDVAQGAAVGGVEGEPAGAVGLADPTGGVDLVGEHHHSAQAGACELAATCTAASRLAGPSAPARVGLRIAPVTTTGCRPVWARSSR